MPSVIAGDIARRVQSLGGDPAKTFITDVDCWDWIMDAQQQIAKITECLTTTVTTSTVANQEMYSLGNSVIKILRVTLSNYRLRSISMEVLDEIDSNRDISGNSGTPTHYFMDGGNIGLWPKPSVSTVNGLIVRARAIPTGVINESSDVIGIPDYFMEDIVRYCMLKVREKDETPEMMQLLYQDWTHKLSVSKDIANNPESASYPTIRDTESMMDYWWEM